MNDQISARQLCVAGFTGSLSLSAAAAWVGWRAALLAIPLVLLAIWAAASAGERTGGLLSGRCGKPLGILYIVWGVYVAGTALTLCGERISQAGGQGGPFWPTVLVGLPVLWLATGKPEAFARASEIFYLAMAAVLVLIFLLGAPQIQWRWLLEEEKNLGRSVLTAAGLGCTGIYALLLWNGRGKGEKRRFLGWSAAAGLVLAGMSALTVGGLSPVLTARVERPFFLMTVGLGQTARVESLIALLWLAADVTLLGLLLQACRGLWQTVLVRKGEKWAGAGFTAVVLALALCLQRFGDPEKQLRDLIPLGSLILGGAVPVLLWALGRKEDAPSVPPIFSMSEEHEDSISGGSEEAEKKQ